MTLLIFICLAAFLWLLLLLRRDRVSLGLPIAYLYSLLLIHVPGAFAHVAGRDFLLNSDLTEIAMRFTALGSICFVAGVWLARTLVPNVPVHRDVDRPQFWWFCLITGWVCVYGLTPLYDIPSVSAAVDKGGGIWMLGVLLGLRAALQLCDLKWTGFWLGALMVYPVLMLLLGGFLSYGSAAIILVCSVVTISTRSYWRLVAGIAIFTFLSLSIFVNYFQHRNEIRNQVWGGRPLDARIDSVLDTLRDFEWFDPADRHHLVALDQRLNQNYFVGLAARRIEQGQVSYLRGESVWEGLLALVPRAFWPGKPVYAGSPQIVSKMTGLRLSPRTSFGVGNVMEFQINFGFPGVIIGFIILGWLIGMLDRKAAVAERRGDLGRLILFFLPCVALIQPNGSLVELFSGAAAALVGAFVWNLAWKRFLARRSVTPNWTPVRSPNRIESSPYKHESAT
jgi:hypothetical protein